MRRVERASAPGRPGGARRRARRPSTTAGAGEHQARERERLRPARASVVGVDRRRPRSSAGRLGRERAPHEPRAVGRGQDRADDHTGERPTARRPEPAVRAAPRAPPPCRRTRASGGTPGHRRGGQGPDDGRDRHRPAEPGQAADVAGVGGVVDDPDGGEQRRLEQPVGEQHRGAGEDRRPGRPAPNSTIRKPSWLTVPYARISLRSCWRSARHPPSSIVARPTLTTSGVHGAASAKAGDNRATR